MNSLDWFHARVLLFHIIFPVILGITTFLGYIRQHDDEEHYDRIYVYTWLILFLHTMTGKALDYIFSLCSAKYYVKTSDNDNSLLLRQKKVKIVHLRYSRNDVMKYIMNICWYAGYNGPTYISHDILSVVLGERLDYSNPDLLSTFLAELVNYVPKLYRLVPVDGESEETNNKVFTKLDNQVVRIKESIFDVANPGQNIVITI